MGLGLARRLLYTGERLNGEEAHRAGLVDRLADESDLLAAAIALAHEIGRRSWRALELTKLSLRQHRPATTGIDLVAQALLFESEEKRRRMDRFLRT